MHQDTEMGHTSMPITLHAGNKPYTLADSPALLLS